MCEGRSTSNPGHIRFHQWCEPPLELGDHSITVTQSVQELEKPGTQTKELRFFVDGPRFSLSPSEVYSVYPPKDQAGDFANSLAHIVFTRHTLPWERPLTRGPRTTADRLPWLALLILSSDDFAPKDFPEIKPLTIGDWLASKTDFVVPQIELAPYESNKERCNTIDLPWQLFDHIAPSKADLAYLAHVREVSTEHKETLSFLADGCFSVVLANRFPQPTAENRAYLVSLEGMIRYLPDGDLQARENAKNKTVRLAVLSSWSFHCDSSFTFKASIESLKVARLCVPWRGETPAKNTPEEYVHRACELGYTALNHRTRLGEPTVSWYRGPLVPLYLTKETKYDFLVAPDAALRYSPLDGMMDVTYAAAFQLGRLLALQDRHFTTALSAYRKSTQRQINQVLGRQRAQSVLGNRDTKAHANELMQRYLQELVPESLGSARGAWQPAQPAGSGENGTLLRLAADYDLTIPSSICQWLGKLLLLYRVPFSYLVPDQRMFPPDSIRFFYLDPGWLKCLLEGACSVGRSSTHDELVDELLRDNFLKLALDESSKVRTKPDEQSGRGSESLKVEETQPQGPNWQKRTGFLLRSPVVKGWQGLEMRAWNDTGKEAATLRIDRLAPEIMLCIFDGQVDRIELKQPPEGMHFGAAEEGDGFKKFHLRWLGKTGNAAPGDQLDSGSSLPIPLRKNVAKRVVDVHQLAQDLKAKLEQFNARDASAEFTSAELGVEMVESPGRVAFDVNPKKPENPATR